MSDPVVVVDGGSGLGPAVASHFAREGAPVALITARPATTELDGVMALTADAADPASFAPAITAVQERWGPVGTLIHVGAAPRTAHAAELSAATLARDFQHQVAGVLIAIHQVLPAMRAAGRGTLLVTSSGADPRSAASSVCGAGLDALVHCLAEDLEPEGIHVASVVPAPALARLDPATVAAACWQLAQQEPGAWHRQLVLGG